MRARLQPARRLVERLYRLLPRPRRVFLAVATVTLVVLGWGLLDAEMRPNMVAELWGAFGASVVVWVFLEHWGDRFARARWLAGHQQALDVGLDGILHNAGRIAAGTLDLPPTLAQELTDGGTRRARREAAFRSIRYSVRIGLAAYREWTPPADLPQRLLEIHVSAAVLDGLTVTYASFVQGLPELEAALTAYTAFARPLLDEANYVGRIGSDDAMGILPAADLNVPELFARVGRRAVSLCEVCSDILEQADRLPS